MFSVKSELGTSFVGNSVSPIVWIGDECTTSELVTSKPNVGTIVNVTPLVIGRDEVFQNLITHTQTKIN